MIIPFSNGTEFQFWLENNCMNCCKSSDGQGTCEIANALYDGTFAGGVTEAIWERMKDVDDCCPELECEQTVDPGPELPL